MLRGVRCRLIQAREGRTAVDYNTNGGEKIPKVMSLEGRNATVFCAGKRGGLTTDLTGLFGTGSQKLGQPLLAKHVGF